MKSPGGAPEVHWEAASVGNEQGPPNPGTRLLGRDTATCLPLQHR